MIRPAKPEDAATLAALSIEVWLDTYAGEGIRDLWASYVLSEFCEKSMRTKLSDPSKHIWLIEKEGFVQGYQILAQPRDAGQGERAAEVETLYIRRHHQGQGLGKKLMDQATAKAREKGWASLFLTANENNIKAIRFYQKLGFKETGEQFFEIDKEAYRNLLLTKDI